MLYRDKLVDRCSSHVVFVVADSTLQDYFNTSLIDLAQQEISSNHVRRTGEFDDILLIN